MSIVPAPRKVEFRSESLFRQWPRCTFGPWLVCSTLALAGISFDARADCNDGIDNDGDTLTDFPSDPGCTDALDVSELGVLDCDDGVDDDFDGLIDFPDDPGCSSATDATEKAAGLPCDDGDDNDSDGLTDYRSGQGTGIFLSDRGCTGPADPSEQSADLHCDDGIDNDGDGQIDFPSDTGCGSPRWPSEAPACSDGIDNDSDGSIDFPADVGCAFAHTRHESIACTDGVDNDGDGSTDDGSDPGCIGFGDNFESSLIVLGGGTIMGYLCETTSADCVNDANFSVTSAVVDSGQMIGPGGKSTYNVDLEIPNITFEGNSGNTERVELTDVTLDGFWAIPFPDNSSGAAFFQSAFNGDIETFDGAGASISGLSPFSVIMDDLSAIAQFASISFCTGSSVETGECSIVFDSDGVIDEPTVDIDGTAHRMILRFDALTLTGSCGDGVVDPGEGCDDGNEVSGDCCSNVCALETAGSSCDDQNACTQIDSCDGGGVCLGASPLVCDDSNGCTDDSCDPLAGCQFFDNSAPCDDTLFCNGLDTCDAGACGIHAGDPCPGPDGDGECAESCDEGAATCTAADPNGSSCTDANVCTTLDSCTSGACAPGAPLDCNDNDVCTADSCNMLTGCAHDPILNCTPPGVPTGSLALRMLAALALAGLGARRLLATRRSGGQ
jgi:cysteine-rich repeat protein